MHLQFESEEEMNGGGTILFAGGRQLTSGPDLNEGTLESSYLEWD